MIYKDGILYWEQKEYAQYPIEMVNRYELKKQQQIELIITKIKKPPIQYGTSY